MFQYFFMVHSINMSESLVVMVEEGTELTERIQQ